MMEMERHFYVYDFVVDRDTKEIALVKAEWCKKPDEEGYSCLIRPVSSLGDGKNYEFEVIIQETTFGLLTELVSRAEMYVKNYLGWNIKEKKNEH